MDNLYKEFTKQYLNIIFQQVQNETYKVVHGDTLSTIAQKFHTTVQKLQQLNNIDDPNKIFVDQELIVRETNTTDETDTSDKLETRDTAKTVSNKSNNSDKNKIVHVVREGQTLLGIAKTYGINVKLLAKMNKIQDVNTINVGRKLVIPKKARLKDTAKKQKEVGANTGSNKIQFIARVIYSQTSTVATDQQIQLVCSVIKNRIGHPGFSYAKDAYSCVNSKREFSCINDPSNKNWNEFKPNLNARTKNAMNLAKLLYSGKFTPTNKEVVFYHDKSINKDFSNKYWDAYQVKQTQHFIFYGIKQK